MEINKRGKILLLTVLTLSATLSVSHGAFLTESIDGKTSKADLAAVEDAEIETIYWDFGEGETVQGRIAKHSFEEGTHNLTAKVVRKNGEIEVHKAKIKVRK